MYVSNSSYPSCGCFRRDGEIGSVNGYEHEVDFHGSEYAHG